jgi:hypothetical protein
VCPKSLVNTTGSGIISRIVYKSTSSWVFTSARQSQTTRPWLPAFLASKFQPKTAYVPPFFPFNHKMRKSMIVLKNIYFYRKFASKAEIAGLLGAGGRAKARGEIVYECASP